VTVCSAGWCEAGVAGEVTWITYTTTLEVRRETARYLARLLAAHRLAVGTRGGGRALGPVKQAVLVPRWFLDGTRMRQLATDNHIGKSTAYDYPREGIDVLAAQAPDLADALTAAQDAGLTHLNPGGTVIFTDRIHTPGPNGSDLWWSGKHKHHGGNIQVLSGPDGWPRWTSEVRPGREHDTTAEEHRAYNALIRGVHALAERANSLLKTTFKALRRVSLDPNRIGAIVKAALVLLHLEYDRTF
jgi:DDE superfamily endonuclease